MAALTELMVAATLDRAKEFSRMEARGFGFADTVGIQGCGPIGLMHNQSQDARGLADSSNRSVRGETEPRSRVRERAHDKHEQYDEAGAS